MTAKLENWERRYPKWVVEAAKDIGNHIANVGKCASDETLAGIIHDHFKPIRPRRRPA